MAKLKITDNSGQIAIKSKLSSNEQINSNEIYFFSQNAVRGFMRPSVQGPGKLLYTGAYGLPLKKFLRRSSINKDQFFMMIAQLMEIYKTSIYCNLNLRNIVLDIQHIIINDRTGELFFVYQPVLNVSSGNVGFINCINQIASGADFNSTQDFNTVNGFMEYISSTGRFYVPDIEGYIMNVSPLTYSIVPRQNFPVSQNTTPPVRQPAPVQNSYTPPQQNTAQPEQKIHTGFTQNQGTAYADDDNFPQSVSRNNAPTAPPVVQSAPVQNSYTPPKQETPVQKNHIPPQQNASPSLLNDDEGTVLLSPLPDEAETERNVFPEAEPPKLVRRSNGETAILNKPVFKIGKEHARVDFCVTNNKTVSRVHATIIIRDGSCFVIDNNSTNKTFINNSPIPVQTEIKLKNGDVLKLSNEEFDFIEG